MHSVFLCAREERASAKEGTVGEREKNKNFSLTPIDPTLALMPPLLNSARRSYFNVINLVIQRKFVFKFQPNAFFKL